MENLAFERYLSAVCDWFPIHRLRKRIYGELSAHMEDMLEDFSVQGMEVQAAREAVLAEMGDAEVLRRELLRAYRPQIWRIRLQRLVLVFAVCILVPNVCMPVHNEIWKYRSSYPLAEAEAYIYAQGAADGAGELAFVGEAEHNGRLYRYYMPKTQKAPVNRVYCMESARVFGKELHDRFAFLSCETTDGCYFMDNLDFESYTNQSCLAELLQWNRPKPEEYARTYIFANPAEVRYFTAQLYAVDEFGYGDYSQPPIGSLPYSEVAAAPGVLVVKYPIGTSLGEERFLDADKNETLLPSGSRHSSSTIF